MVGEQLGEQRAGRAVDRHMFTASTARTTPAREVAACNYKHR